VFIYSSGYCCFCMGNVY